ncbi:acyl-CoA synthetase member 2 mitochondrial [Aspergillus viridinutans]|uniref:Acyl-CoA synthetase member 2 mitochondrial n=1 Tax=Aspergillus viridinutans TaxID=75553 RepID=A0A9P3BZC2_ASPVI|nr:acyl-CoA synthetase member 2 mitochondrial [Aspergillus viridinutans]GIK05040.1 acyl-CoA synthetase member 2 mitochondrial [Aspergillus viridinutans]
MANTSTTLSIVQGSAEHALWELTLGQLVDQQAEGFGCKDAIIVPWSSARLSFRHLSQRSQDLAKGLLAKGVVKGDRVAIFSSDDERFIELFFAVGRIGAILVVLNKTYTVQECDRALRYSGED